MWKSSDGDSVLGTAHQRTQEAPILCADPRAVLAIVGDGFEDRRKDDCRACVDDGRRFHRTVHDPVFYRDANRERTQRRVTVRWLGSG